MQDGMVSFHLETKQTKAKQRKKEIINNRLTNENLRVPLSHEPGCRAEATRGFARGGCGRPSFHKQPTYTVLARFKCVSLYSVLREAWRSMGCWRRCQESEDKQDFDFTQLVLRQQLSCWTQTVQKISPHSAAGAAGHGYGVDQQRRQA